MKEMTATQVARNFSQVLDAVEAGEEVVILRGKTRIAVLKPNDQSWHGYAPLLDLWNPKNSWPFDSADDPWVEVEKLRDEIDPDEYDYLDPRKGK